jgi:ligand-binding sensor domain-containing protein
MKGTFMILLEEFVYAKYCGDSMYYTSRSFSNDGYLWMIDWTGSEKYTNFSDWSNRDRNKWRKVIG